MTNPMLTQDDAGRGRDHIGSRIASAGGNLVKIAGLALLAYITAMAVFAIYKYSATKSTLLSYGVSDATGTLLAWAVMFIAIGIPALAILRIFVFVARPYDYVAAMILPLISWGMAQIPANFNAQTGEALKYCSYRPDNNLFCLDHPGIDPLTQKKLVPMNQNLAELEFRRNRGLAPKRIAQPLANIVFFDPLTSEPRVWVHKNDQGCFDLFDNPGADPQTGEKLSPITKEAVRLIRDCEIRTLRDQERTRAAGLIANTTPQAIPSKPATQRTLVVPANGYSDHVLPPIGYATTYTGHGYVIHCVYDDGREGIVGSKEKPCSSGNMLYQYLRDTTGQTNIVTYEFVRPGK